MHTLCVILSYQIPNSVLVVITQKDCEWNCQPVSGYKLKIQKCEHKNMHIHLTCESTFNHARMHDETFANQICM